LISALYGLTHGIVAQTQYSFLVAAVIASAVVPTLIAGMAFLPKHLIPLPEKRPRKKASDDRLGEEGRTSRMRLQGNIPRIFLRPTLTNQKKHIMVRSA
jgi:hypothetical protein